MRGTKKLIYVSMIFITLQGCKTIRDGNDTSSLYLESDLELISKAMDVENTIPANFSTDSSAQLLARNKYVNGRVAIFDIEYLKYVRSLSLEKQQFDAGSDLSVMILNIAGTLTGGVQAKANLAASAAGIGGAKVIVNKEFYYEKSIDALVATMDANRAEIFADIFTSLKSKSVEDYSFPMAVRDLARYQRAGTIQGAVEFIQKTATISQKESNKVIADLVKAVPLTAEQDARVRRITDAIGGKELTLQKANAILKNSGMSDASLPDDLESKNNKPGAKELLAKINYEATHDDDEKVKEKKIAKLYLEFKNQGLITE